MSDIATVKTNNIDDVTINTSNMTLQYQNTDKCSVNNATENTTSAVKDLQQILLPSRYKIVNTEDDICVDGISVFVL